MSLKSLKNQTLRNKSTINSVNLTGGASTGPVITSIIVTDSNYNNLDDTALLPAGGYAKLIGSGFASGCSAYFNGSSVTTTFVSATEVRVVIPATTAGTYNVMLFNPSTAGAIYLNLGISSAPTFTTSAGSLGTSYETTAVSTSIAATGDDPITYALYSGSLPTGVTLASNGTLSGTSPVEASSTTYSFVVQATDAQLQDTTRSFSLTISTDVVTWSTPAADFAYTLDGNAAMSNVSLSAASAAGYNITYAANTLPTGVSLSGNTVFGTPTVEQTVYTALTATAATTGRSATRYVSWSVVLGDTYWKYNTLLLPGASTTFVDDASTNNFAATITGDPRPNSFNPYTPGYYSNYFDGTGDYLSLASTSTLAFGTGDFCVEMYYYQTTNVGLGLFSNSASSGGGDAQFEIQLDPTNRYPQLVGWATIFLTSSVAGALNSWNHLVVCRSGTTTSIFLNGTRVATATVSNNFSSVNAFNIGRSASGGNTLTGYMSNVRAVKGSSVYDPTLTTLTVPTIPLTTIANTSLLTCQSNRFIDNSTNNFTITVAGNTTVRSFNPFVPNASYSTYGSTYLNGSAAYINIPNNAAFAFGTGDFTIEFWVNTTDPSGGLVSQGVTGGWATTFYSNTVYWQSSWNQVNLWTSPASSITNGVWHHLAFSRASGSTKFFIDGVLAATNADTTNYSVTSGSLIIGRDGNPTDLDGYISDLRVVKGTAVYTANFTPPSAPLTAVSGTSLLTLQNNQPVNNSTFLDNSTNNFFVTRNGNTTQGTFSPYGGNWSNYFDGNGDYLNTPSNAAFGFGTGDFTIEFWAYSTSSARQDWIDITDGSNRILFYYSPEGAVSFYGNGGLRITGSAITLNTWTHYALSKSSGSTKMFVNGVQAGSTYATSQNYGTVSSVTIGKDAFASTYITGYMSNIRIVKGTALYTSNFTPSTTPLTPITNTSLLTCADNRLVDDSINNFTITKNGDVSVQRFSPFNPSSVTPSSYSGYFGASNGNCLYLASTASGTGGVALSGNYTIEMWLYPTAASGSGYSMLVATQTQGGVFQFYYNSAGNIGYYTPAFGQPTTSSAPLTFNTWQHIALVRSSNSVKVYVNGVEKAFSSTITDSSTIYANYIGGLGTVYNTFGYISNLRITNTAVYTTTFTPPTSPLTAISGTQLLTLQSDTIIDNSTNKYTINVDGSPQPTIQNPFGYTSALTNGYTPSTIGGSGYFDGTGDYLSIPNNTVFNFVNNRFTIECWIYPTSFAAQTIAICKTPTSSSYGPFEIRVNTNGTILVYVTSSGSSWDFNFTSTPAVKLNQWNHIALTRTSAGLFTIWVNGVNGATYTWDYSIWSSTTSIVLGAYGNGTTPFTGYIADARFVNGTALYTSNFVPPAAPLTAVQNTVLLNNMTSAGVYDAAMMNNLETVGDAKLSTAVSKFGGSSMSFDGSGDRLFASSSPNLEFGTGDFTVECWAYWNAGVADGGFVGSVNQGGIDFSYLSGTLRIGRVNTSWDSTFSSFTPTAAVWYHIAFTRNSGTARVFVNGTQVGSNSTNNNSYVPTGGMIIGASNTSDRPFNGYIDDLRITKGYARYTSNFTAPTATFQIK